jgi:predicted permease
MECVAIDTQRRRHMMRMKFIAERTQDIRYALRMLRRAPAFTMVAVLTLALGIGANAAVFSRFHDLLLRPVPVPEPDQLVNFSAPGPKPGPKSCGGVMGDCDGAFSYPMFRDLERVQTVFTGIAAHRDFEVNLGYRGETLKGAGMFVSGGYFPVLRLRAALGRLLGPEDDRSMGGSEVVVLSHEYWQNQYGARSDVLEEAMFVNGVAMTIVGVAPQGFEGTTRGLKPQVFVPITMRWRLQPWPGSPPENRRGYWLYLFARLKPGVSVEQARTAIDGPYRAIINDVEAPLQEGLSEQTMAQFKAKTIRVEPGSRGQSNIADAEAPLTLLLGVTALVLLITCMNVANLLLARAAGRSREVATRLSIGATRGRLVAQFLTECAVLGFAAALASLVLVQWTMALVDSLLPADLPIVMELDTSTIIFTAVLALGVTIAIGLFPALHAVRPGALSALRAQSGQQAAGRGAARFRISLAAAQVALSMVLVVLAGLFTKSLANISQIDPGLVPDGLVMFAISPQRNGYTAPRAAALFERLQDELAALPGVTAVSSSTTPLLSGSERVTSAFVEGFDVGPDTDNDTRYDEIGDGYFRTLSIPMIAGRDFTRADSENAAQVVIVNEQFARKFGLGRNAVGKRMSSRTPALDLEIVGLVKNIRHSSLRDVSSPMHFVPHRQSNRRPGFMTFYVRTSLNTDELMSAIPRVMFRLDPNLPIEMRQTVHEAMRRAMVRERLLGVMISAFAALAILVAAVGLYGVLAYTVAQRTAEIGLRIALGATRARVRWMVLRQVGLITLVGGTIGLVGAILIGRAAQALLFGLQFHDTAVLASAIVVLMLVVIAAGFLPADRAARLDPMHALKYD